MRAAALIGVLVLGLVVLTLRMRAPVTPEAGDPMPRLAFVATANQQGIVGYRDPVGALSPDGRRIAYSEGRFLRVVPVGGGVSPALPPAGGQIRWTGWLDDARVIVEDATADSRWWIYDPDRATRQSLWSKSEVAGLRVNDLRQVVASADGKWLAGVAAGKDGPAIWKVAADGTSAERLSVDGRPASPAWMPGGELACVVMIQGRGRIAAPCGAQPLVSVPDVEAIGPLAVAPDGRRVYFASPNTTGVVDFWVFDRESRRSTRLAAFERDSYAPSVSTDGTVLFKTQSYRTTVAELRQGRTHQLTTFQSETPWWHPAEPLISVTYGTWRRLVDDAKYPDIAQEIGVIDADRGTPSDEPQEVIARSDSEDQAMAWSPNRKWIALHSHREMSDDIWLRPADGSAPDRRITMLGRGAEVGWPRWSPDGRTVLLDGANRAGRSVAYTIGVDQESGRVTSDLREIATPGFEGDIMHAEWLPDGRRIAAVARDGPGLHALIVVPVDGGRVTVAHRVNSEHDFPGLTVSPDGGWLGFVAPASDGFYQIFRVPVMGGEVEQLTTDPSHKSQPAWSPTGRLAFAVWSYTATFWTLRP